MMKKKFGDATKDKESVSGDAVTVIKSDSSKATKKPVKYYCNKGEYVFALPEYERDEFGEVITNEKGQPKKLYKTDADGNNKVLASVVYKFERVPVKDPKSGRTSAIEFLGRFIVEPENDRYDDLVEYLYNAKKNPFSGIMTEEEYKENRNPEAYATERENAMLMSDNEALRKRNEELQRKLEDQGILPKKE